MPCEPRRPPPPPHPRRLPFSPPPPPPVELGINLLQLNELSWPKIRSITNQSLYSIGCVATWIVSFWIYCPSVRFRSAVKNQDQYIADKLKNVYHKQTFQLNFCRCLYIFYKILLGNWEQNKYGKTFLIFWKQTTFLIFWYLKNYTHFDYQQCTLAQLRIHQNISTALLQLLHPVYSQRRQS